MIALNERERKFRLLANELIDSAMGGHFRLAELLTKRIRAFSIEDLLKSPKYNNDEKAKLRKELKFLTNFYE